MRLQLPYDKFEDIQFNNDETLNFAYFNSHIRKLFENFDAYVHVQKLPVATDSSYGLVRLASERDMEDGTHPESVLPFNNFQDFVRSMSERQRKSFESDGTMSLANGIEVVSGSITVPSGFYIGKRVVDRPSQVMFAHVMLEVPGMAHGNVAYDLDDRRYTCFNRTDSSKFLGNQAVELGKVRFERDDDEEEPKGLRRVEAYYKDGVVVVRNEAFADNRGIGTSSVRALWMVIRNKT